MSESYKTVNSTINWKETMAALMNQEEEIREEGTSQVQRIDTAIKQLAERRECVNKSEKMLRYWKLQESALSTSIWAREVKCNELQKRENDHRVIVSQRMSLDQLTQEELRDMLMKRKQQWTETCANFHAACKEYSHKFLEAHMEYSSEHLEKDIKQHQMEINKINEQLTLLQKKISKMEEEYNCNCKSICKEVEGASMAYNILKLNNDGKLQKVRSKKDQLLELQVKIKQRKLQLDAYKKKQITN